MLFRSVLTNGGRVLCVTGLGSDVHAAREHAYRAFDLVHWSGKTGRRDIGLPRAARSAAGADEGEASGAFTGGPRAGERGPL